MEKPYKAFDFVSGYTYLIGRFQSRSAAEAYCKLSGIVTISQTLVALTEEEYQSALSNRRKSEEK